MAETDPDAETALSTLSKAKSYVASAVATLLVVVGLVGWSVFWSIIVRLHYRQGDLESAAVTTALLIVPAVAILAWYLGETFGVDLPTPDLPVSVGSD